jgi:hypothetical protein
MEDNTPRQEQAPEDMKERIATHKPLNNANSIRLVKFEIITPKPGFVISEGWSRDNVSILHTDEEIQAAEQLLAMPVVECFDLDECPWYLALSYTWGDAFRQDDPKDASSAPHQIMKYDFGSGPFHIPVNLKIALDHLAISYRDKWLWIDAICIDQQNNVEKAHQVSIMGRIFSQASAVVVWLGPSSSHLADFKWMHWDFLDALFAYGKKYGFDTLRKQHPYDRDFLMMLNVTPPCGSWSEAWGRYFDFLRHRTWFTRAWVVQEVALAKEIYVECGKSCIYWQRIQNLANFISTFGWHISAATVYHKTNHISCAEEVIRICRIIETSKKFLHLQEQGKSYSAHLKSIGANVINITPNKPDMYNSIPMISNVLNNRTARRSRPISRSAAASFVSYWLPFVAEIKNTYLGRSTIAFTRKLNPDAEPPWIWFYKLQDILYLARPYKSTDPRDKIYAFVGIAQKMLPRNIVMPIVPDYSSASSPQQLYTEVSTLLLMRTPCLSLLSYVEDKTARNFQDLPTWVPDYSCSSVPDLLTSQRFLGLAFDCCPATYGPAIVHVIGKELRTYGSFFGKVVAVSRPINDSLNGFDISSWFEMCAELSAKYHHTGENLEEAFWRTLIADTFQFALPNREFMGRAFKRWIRVHLAMTMAQKRKEGSSYTNTVKLIQRILQPFGVQDPESDHGHDAPGPPAVLEFLPTLNEICEQYITTYTTRIPRRVMFHYALAPDGSLALSALPLASGPSTPALKNASKPASEVHQNDPVSAEEMPSSSKVPSVSTTQASTGPPSCRSTQPSLERTSAAEEELPNTLGSNSVSSIQFATPDSDISASDYQSLAAPPTTPSITKEPQYMPQPSPITSTSLNQTNSSDPVLSPEAVAALDTTEVAMATGERISQPFEDALQAVMKHRRLFITENGCLGLGPQSTAISDAVWMLQGGCVPFVLREGKYKIEKKHEFVGECYVHGYMHGKMAEQCWKKMTKVKIV